MMLAGLLTLILAQVTASPSPFVTKSPEHMATLSFADALNRLIPHAIDSFSEDQGHPISKRGDVTVYEMNFAIAGLQDCQIAQGAITCVVHSGPDAPTAHTAFYALKAELRQYAGRGAYIEETATLTTAKITTASYFPQAGSCEVEIVMTETKNASDVAFRLTPVFDL